MKWATFVWLAATALTLFLITGPIQTALAQWSNDPNVNTPVATQSGSQHSTQLCGDGTGGAIIAWVDMRNDNGDIYAQRLNAAGVPQWATDGVAICAEVNGQYSLRLTTDGSGGAVLAWADHRNGSYDIYAQRVSSSGTVQWIANGVEICASTLANYDLQISSDSLGGALITWTDNRSGNADIYAQRVNSSGVAQWPANGVAICTTPQAQDYSQLTGDGSSGAIITWVDNRSGPSDIYSQRVNSSGVVQWATNGVAICAATGGQYYPQLASDGSGGVIIAWADDRNSYSSYGDIYAQNVNSSGVVEWTTNGVAICTATGSQDAPQLVSDGSGGAIIAWEDARNDPSRDIFAQNVNSSGVTQWTTNGVAICTANYSQTILRLVSNGSGGAIITWTDRRNSNNDIYAQSVNSSGVVEWTTNGVAICTAIGSQDAPQLVNDCSGGAIIAWEDVRNGSGNADIYAQHVGSDGTLPVQLSSFHVRRLSHGEVLLNWVTISEVSNYGFYVQRSLQNTQQWEDLPNSFVPGHGTTNQPHNYSFTDNAAPAGELEYRLKQIDLDGTIHYSEPISVSSLTSVKEPAPIEFALEQNYPNPFNPTTEIRYQTSEVGHVTLTVYDVLGRQVTTLVNAVEEPGYKSVQFDATNLSSGMYFYKLESGSFAQSKKMLIIK